MLAQLLTPRKTSQREMLDLAVWLGRRTGKLRHGIVASRHLFAAASLPTARLPPPDLMPHRM